MITNHFYPEGFFNPDTLHQFSVGLDLLVQVKQSKASLRGPA